MYFYYWDSTYIFVLIAIVLAMWASARVKSTFKKYSKIRSISGMSGEDAARRVLQYNGITNVQIERVQGNLTDHYDPKSNTIRLSDSVYDVRTPAAIGVAAHEAGHAVQYARNYLPIKLRNLIIPATNIGSRMAMPLILIGLIFSSAGNSMIMFAYAGILCFSLSVLFQFVTLPTEFNASRRAIVTLRDNGMLQEEEMTAVRKVLTAAALTYVAALAVALTQLVRLLSIVGRRN